MPLGHGDAIAIGVPVRNEVARLPRLLDALAAQAATPFTLCLFFDNCDDGSEQLAMALAGRLPYRMITGCCRRGGPPNAGLARNRAMALAQEAAPDGVLLTTDADGEPSPDWIANTLAALDAADLVAGRIVRGSGPPSPWQDRVEGYFDGLHALRRRIDPVPWEAPSTHHWSSGASLAMRARVYRALGGFAPLPKGEDAALCDAAARAGYRLRRDASIVVRTSARRRGRAQGGFATALATLDARDHVPIVSHPDDEAWRFRLQAEARAAFAVGGVAALAAPLRLPLDEVERVAAESRHGEAFAARIVGTPPGGMRTVGLPHAELLLAALEQSPMEGAA